MKRWWQVFRGFKAIIVFSRMCYTLTNNTHLAASLMPIVSMNTDNGDDNNNVIVIYALYLCMLDLPLQKRKARHSGNT